MFFFHSPIFDDVSDNDSQYYDLEELHNLNSTD